jgi:hypothetical protein
MDELAVCELPELSAIAESSYSIFRERLFE